MAVPVTLVVKHQISVAKLSLLLLEISHREFCKLQIFSLLFPLVRLVVASTTVVESLEP
jgi:hypothetical protein